MLSEANLTSDQSDLDERVKESLIHHIEHLNGLVERLCQ